MRTYKNLVKRMNLVKEKLNTLPKRLCFADLAIAYKGETYLRKSYEVLMQNGIQTELKEKNK